jgi:LysM repeat protein
MMLGIALLAGCGRGIRTLDERDRSLPLMQRARAAASTGDIDGAADLYRQALIADPGAARAHLDLAFLLHDTMKDYVGAIYHYRGYLRLRPDTQKADMIKNRVRLAEQALAARVLPEDRQVGRTIKRLEQEVSALRVRVGELKAENAALSKQLAERPVAPPMDDTVPDTATPAVPPPAAGPGVIEYVVKPGDTLSSIAVRMYGDAAKWRDIVKANKAVLGNGDLVKVGQRLRIVKEE